jgi:hypothetical protein
MPNSIISLEVEALLGVIVVLTLIIERALAVPFESKAMAPLLSQKPLKEPIAVLVSLLVCMYWHIDVITVLVQGMGSRPDFWGELLTATMIAGGSKASLKLFQDVLGIKNKAHEGGGSTPSPGANTLPEPVAPKPISESPT